jgi:hypothetical protein
VEGPYLVADYDSSVFDLGQVHSQMVGSYFVTDSGSLLEVLDP